MRPSRGYFSPLAAVFIFGYVGRRADVGFAVAVERSNDIFRIGGDGGGNINI